jgi:hypothetical protein
MQDDLKPDDSPKTEKKGRFRAFWDFFVLFSGVSTAANLSRTQTHPVRPRGFFLFRGMGKTKPDSKVNTE